MTERRGGVARDAQTPPLPTGWGAGISAKSRKPDKGVKILEPLRAVRQLTRES